VSYRVKATLSTLASDEGGLSDALSNPTRSVVVRFPDGDDPNGQVVLGAIISFEGTKGIRPGIADEVASIEFWSDDAARVAAPGRPFWLWYGRHIGDGRVLSRDRA